MKIGLISDTHTPSTGKEPPPQVAKAFQGVDLILHAGDIYHISCIDWLEKIAPVQAVEFGTLDHFHGDERVASRRALELDGHAVGLVHDLNLRGMAEEPFPGYIAPHFPDGSLPPEVERFFGKKLDIVVFGHTHVALLEEHQGILFVNPGSPTLPNQQRKLGTVAILELTPEGPEVKIIELAEL
ncbi:MAG: YfcE family phosphodiesterase [Dehalococcoidia bacterium]|nr:YfcE family phosphodiesterase [Dehalococcoidia bacterium]